MSQFGTERVLIITDANVHAAGLPQRIADSLGRYGIRAEIFDGVHVEPTDDSMNEAAGYAKAQGPWDGFIAVGGGSGIDIVCHALESYTARWYADYDRRKAEERVTYCGANPISDLWCERAMSLLARSFRTAVRDGGDVEARSNMMMAATFAGMGFGNSGVHIPHANAYPIAGMLRDYVPEGYPPDEPMVPHGQSVSLTAPQAFRFTFPAAPERHIRAAALLGPMTDRRNDDREQLPAVVTELMRDIGIPNGIGAVGYTEDDVPDLVPGTMKQQRLLSTCPRPVTEDDIAGILTKSVE